MKRYYAHFTIIYPNIYLKNIIVELDCDRRISELIPFGEEIEKTEFRSGSIYLIPSHYSFDRLTIENLKNEVEESRISDVLSELDKSTSYDMYDDSFNEIRY